MPGKTSVMYLQRDRFQIYTPQVTSILEFRYVPEMIKDLDVLNKTLLEGVISVFIEQNKMLPGNLIIFLADNVSFLRDFTMPDVETSAETPKEPEGNTLSGETAKKLAMEKQIKDYVDLIPFEDVVIKRFVIKNGVRVFAANKELYIAIKEAFEKADFTVDLVIPGFLLGNNISAQSVLTPEIGEFVLQHVSSLKQNNLLSTQIIQEEAKEEPQIEENNYEVKEEKTKPKTNKRLFLLVGVLIFLLVVLVVVYFMFGR